MLKLKKKGVLVETCTFEKSLFILLIKYLGQ